MAERVDIRVVHSDTEREVWTFCVLQYPTAYLDRYALETRVSRRHRKWRPSRSWHRLNNSSHHVIGERISDEPVVPPAVMSDALAALRAQVRIDRWTDYQARVSSHSLRSRGR